MPAKTALVTGSSGFIGRHLVRHLEIAGYQVHGIDVAYPRHQLPYFSLFDARDFFRRNQTRYDLVVHCAAVVGGRETIDNAPMQQAVNFELDAGLFQFALRTLPGRVVYLSSSAVYPLAHQFFAQALTESSVNVAGGIRLFGVPDQLYGWSKLTGEILAQKSRDLGLSVTIVRPFSGYGEDQGPDYPFGAFAQRSRKREDPFVVWGDGNQTRDWIHVNDICRAILTLVEQNVDGPINLGTGIGTTMAELALSFTEAAGYEPVFEFQPDKPTGVRYRVADVSRLRKYYTPKISVEEGVKRALCDGGVT